MEKEDIILIMGKFMMVNGKKIKILVNVSIILIMVIYLMVIYWMINFIIKEDITIVI